MHLYSWWVTNAGRYRDIVVWKRKSTGDNIIILDAMPGRTFLLKHSTIGWILPVEDRASFQSCVSSTMQTGYIYLADRVNQNLGMHIFIIISKSVLSRLPNCNYTLLVISTKKIYNNSVKLYDYIRWKKNLGSFTVRFYFFYYFLAKHMFYIVETKLYLKN